MGRRIVSIIEETEGIELCGGTDLADGPFVGKDIGDVAGIGTKGIPIAADLESI